jgi:two-component system LytT family response regulator
MIPYITAVILDDEQEAIDLLSMHLNMIPSVKLLKTFQKPQDAFLYVAGEQPDVVFMDIEMPLYSGFDMLQYLQNMKQMPVVVFVTGHDKYLPYIETGNSLFALLKPVDPKLLSATITEILKNLEQQKSLSAIENSLTQIKQADKLHVPTIQGTLYLKYSDVVYCKADGNYTYIYLNDGSPVHSSFTLKKFEAKLSHSNFIRCHNCAIINTDYLFKTNKKTNTCTLKADKEYEIPVSRSGWKLLENLV